MNLERPSSFHPIVPIHHQITRLLRSQIASGEIHQGDKLPTEAELAKRYSVSRNTIREALRALELEKLIVRTRGRGTFVASVPKAAERLLTNLVFGFETHSRLHDISDALPPAHVRTFFNLERNCIASPADLKDIWPLGSPRLIGSPKQYV